MLTTTVTLPVATHRRLRVAAVKRNMPLTELMRRVLSEWLARRSRRSQ
jgi:hypothetical protein